MTLYDMALDAAAAIDAIAAFLDGLSHEERLAATRTLGRKEQRLLYGKAAAAPPVSLDAFVPKEAGALAQVIHHGRNTLPLPGKHRLFQKRFCRPESESGSRHPRLFGYNEAPSKGLLGPGYFVAVETAGEPEWEARGAVVVDYFQVPDGPVPAGWPRVVPNTEGLQFFVYNKTRDFMRRISSHVTIGAAYKKEKSLDHYFILCREP